MNKPIYNLINKQNLYNEYIQLHLLSKYPMGYTKSNLTRNQYIYLILNRLCKDKDCNHIIYKYWKLVEEDYNKEWYLKIYDSLRYVDTIKICQDYYNNKDKKVILPINNQDLMFEIKHFYPNFLSKLDTNTLLYKQMNIKEKIKLINHMNQDKKTILFRKKSIYLYHNYYQNRYNDNNNYIVENFINLHIGNYLIGIMSYNEQI